MMVDWDQVWCWAGWEALTAVGTLGATLVALGFGLRDVFIRRSDRKAQSGKHVKVAVIEREGRIEIENRSRGHLTGIRYQMAENSPDLLGLEIAPGETAPLRGIDENVRDVSQLRVYFTDATGVTWLTEFRMGRHESGPTKATR